MISRRDNRFGSIKHIIKHGVVSNVNHLVFCACSIAEEKRCFGTLPYVKTGRQSKVNRDCDNQLRMSSCSRMFLQALSSTLASKCNDDSHANRTILGNPTDQHVITDDERR